MAVTGLAVLGLAVAAAVLWRKEVRNRENLSLAMKGAR